MDRHINCAIRRIYNCTVWYLHSLDPRSGETTWTRQFRKAHQFVDEEEAEKFMRTFLGPARSKECDTFSEYETWSI